MKTKHEITFRCLTVARQLNKLSKGERRLLPVLKTIDRANEFRVHVEGRLAGESVQQLSKIWSEALAEALPRRISIDISYLTGYDAGGRKLLREMHLRGTNIAASTAGSLVFLAEITAPRRGIVTVVPEVIESRPPGRAMSSGERQAVMAAAAGS